MTEFLWIYLIPLLFSNHTQYFAVSQNKMIKFYNSLESVFLTKDIILDIVKVLHTI